MPELPEVEALALFVTEKAGGTTVERAELGSLSALKTYKPPLDSLSARPSRGPSGGVSTYASRWATSGSLPTWPGRVGCIGATRSRRRTPAPAAAPWRCGWGCRRGRGST